MKMYIYFSIYHDPDTIGNFQDFKSSIMTSFQGGLPLPALLANLNLPLNFADLFISAANAQAI